MEKVEELKKKIEKWQEELDTVWSGKDTDAAEVERRNLRDLISNAKKEIEEIENPKSQNELGENFEALKEKYDDMKQEEADKELKINKLKLKINKLTDERENYAALKNLSYKDIYDEYTKNIEEAKKEIEELEKEEPQEEKDKKIKEVTALRIEYDKQIGKKKKEIREVQREIEDIEFETEEAMVEKELSDGTKVTTPKILDLKKKKGELEKELKDLEKNKAECEAYIDQIKGIEEKIEKKELSSEEIEYYHGQGDRIENTRDDVRANDEYFGFEKVNSELRKEQEGEKIDNIQNKETEREIKYNNQNKEQEKESNLVVLNKKKNPINKTVETKSKSNNQLIKKSKSIFQRIQDWKNSRKMYKGLKKSIKNMPENAYEFDEQNDPYEIRKSIQKSSILSNRQKEKLYDFITNKYPGYMKHRENVDQLFNQKPTQKKSNNETINKHDLKNKIKDKIEDKIEDIKKRNNPVDNWYKEVEEAKEKQEKNKLTSNSTFNQLRKPEYTEATNRISEKYKSNSSNNMQPKSQDDSKEL